MGFLGAIRSGFRHYARATGRASRSEYWYWMLFSALVSVAGGLIDMAIFGANSERVLVGPLMGLVLVAPDVAVTIRRLQDLDRKWVWFLIVFTGIGAFVLLVWFCLKGTTGSNRFGEDPLAADNAPAPSGTVRVTT